MTEQELNKFKVDLEKPAGVKYMSLNNVTVDVKLSSDISNVEIPDVSISTIKSCNLYIFLNFRN